MLDAPTCLWCGHPAFAHRPVARYEGTGLVPRVSADGSINCEMVLGPCSLEEYGWWCSCTGYEPDTLSRVTALLGLDVRRVIA